MKDFLKRTVAGALVIAFIVPTTFAFMPKKAEAQAGKISACIAGLLTAVTASSPAWVKEIIGVPTGDGKTPSTAVKNTASNDAISFNSCILQPLAKIMIITLIRQIGSSVVDWVNNGFEGKPSFVTDFEGTIRDAADNALGEFIEGSDLGWLCSSFSFQIRVALAMKYSKPWKKKAQCTLTDIKENIDNFVQNNGGAGWNNWLQITSEPQNNWIGAYYMADSELAERMMKASGIKKDRIMSTQGFLDFETCDDWKNVDDVGYSNSLEVTTENQSANFFAEDKNGKVSKTIDSKTTQTVDMQNFSTSNSQYGTNTFRTENGVNQVCAKKTTKTPGTVIAGKLNSSFMQGDIQQAVAQEIDDVIAATLNQLAQKMMTGAMGLLGLSKKKGGSNVNYAQKYEASYWGGQVPTASSNVDTGAQSEMDAYRNETSDFSATQNLVNTNTDTQAINQYTDQKAQEAYNNQQEQYNNLTNQFTNVVNASERNLALGKTATQSTTDNPAMNAINGINTEGSNTTSRPASTHQVSMEEALYSGNIGDVRPWWRVDLGKAESIKEVRIYPVRNKPVNITLETFTITLSNDVGDGSASADWTSGTIIGAADYPMKIPVSTPGTWKYVTITKNAKKDSTCYQDSSSYQYGVQYAACYHALEIAEVEVIGVSETTTPPSGTNNGGTNTNTNPTNGSGTLSWTSSQNNIQVVKGNLVSFNQTLAGANRSNLTITTTLYEGAKNITFGSLFSVLTIAWGNGSIERNKMTFDSTMTHGALKLTNVSTTNTSQFFLKYNGLSKSSIKSGTYRIEAVVTDETGNNLGTLSTQFVIQ